MDDISLGIRPNSDVIIPNCLAPNYLRDMMVIRAAELSEREEIIGLTSAAVRGVLIQHVPIREVRLAVAMTKNEKPEYLKWQL